MPSIKIEEKLIEVDGMSADFIQVDISLPPGRNVDDWLHMNLSPKEARELGHMLIEQAYKAETRR
jgi:hypothetical protein